MAAHKKTPTKSRVTKSASPTTVQTVKASKATKVAKAATIAAVVEEDSTTAPQGRHLRLPRRMPRRLRQQAKIMQKSRPKLPGSFRLFKSAVTLVWRNKKLFGGILLIYAILTVIFVQNFSNANSVTTAKSTLDDFSKGHWAHLVNSAAIFAYLLGNSNASSDPSAGVYQSILLLVMSLAFIWAIRAAYSQQKVRIRDSFYQGMFPIIPFVLVLMVLGLEVIPFAIGIALYTTVLGGGIASGAAEQTLWLSFVFGTTLISLYLLCTSIFAIYIVCLPEMTPIAALRAARKLVRFRRWTVIRKLLFLPLALLILAAVVIIPLILFATPAAGWVFLLLVLLALPLIHSYGYNLYRALL